MNNNTYGTEKETLKFTTIYHKLRIESGMSFIEYCLLDSIHKLGSNPKYKYWCTHSQYHFADLYGCSRAYVITLYKKHIEKTGYLERPSKRQNNDTRIRTTQKYYDEFVVFIPSAATSISTLPVNKVDGVVNKVDGGSKQSLPNSYSYKDSNKLVNLLDNLKGEDIPIFCSNGELITFLMTKKKDEKEVQRFMDEENVNCPKAYAAFNMAREKYPDKSGNYICGVAFKILQSNQYVHESFD